MKIIHMFCIKNLIQIEKSQNRNLIAVLLKMLYNESELFWHMIKIELV